jgi:hypothetical protein
MESYAVVAVVGMVALVIVAVVAICKDRSFRAKVNSRGMEINSDGGQQGDSK